LFVLYSLTEGDEIWRGGDLGTGKRHGGLLSASQAILEMKEGSRGKFGKQKVPVPSKI